MRATPALTTAASLAALTFALVAGSALAQSQPGDDDAMPPAAEESMMPADSAAPAAPYSTTTDIAAEAGQQAAIPLSSPTPVAQAYMLKAGDPTVVSNTPVPDTPATRRAYGGPDSNGGRQTRPVGN